MATNRTKVVKKTVRGWAVISPDGYIPMWGNHQLLVYRDRKSARENKGEAYYDETGKVVECTITYTITNTKKK